MGGIELFPHLHLHNTNEFDPSIEYRRLVTLPKICEERAKLGEAQRSLYRVNERGRNNAICLE